MKDMQEPPTGLIVVEPYTPQPGMGPLGRGPEINYEEAAAFREAVAAKRAEQETTEVPEEPALLGYAAPFDEDDLVSQMDRRSSRRSRLIG